MNVTLGAITKEMIIPFHCTGMSTEERGDRIGFEAEFILNPLDFGLSLEIGSGSGHDEVKIILALEGFRIGMPILEPPKTGSPVEVSKATRPRLGLTPPGEIQKQSESDRPTLVDKRGKRKPLSIEEADPSGTEFMGIKTKARSIVFILDFSGSMHQEKDGSHAF